MIKSKKMISKILAISMIFSITQSIVAFANIPKDENPYTFTITADKTDLEISDEDQTVVFSVHLSGTEEKHAYAMQFQFMHNENLILSDIESFSENEGGYYINENIIYHNKYMPEGAFLVAEYLPSTRIFACYGSTKDRNLQIEDVLIMTIEATIPAGTYGDFSLDILQWEDGGDLNKATVVTSQGSISNLPTVVIDSVIIENPATGIDITDEEITLSAGGTQALTANVTPIDTTDEIEWTSSDSDVAIVDENGNVSAVSAGSATITAKAGDYSDSVSVEVNAKSQDALVISSANTVNFNDTLTLETTGGSGSGGVSYEVTNGTGEATISGNTLNATQVGTVTVKATKAGDSEFGSVTSAPQEITINKIDYDGAKSQSIDVAQASANYKATLPALPTGAMYDFSNKTSSGFGILNASLNGSELVLNVDATSNNIDDIGYIEIPVINATNYNDFAYRVNMKVVDKTPQNISFNDAVYNANFGDDDFAITVNGANTTVTYGSSNEAVATVNPTTGEVSIVGVGSTNITATAVSEGIYASANATYNLLISPKELTADMVSAIEDVTYNGLAHEPSVEVTDEVDLTIGTDYTVSYSDNINAGQAKVTITGTGNYTGDIEKTFKIVKATISDGMQSTTVRYNDIATKTVAITGIPTDANVTNITISETDNENIIGNSNISSESISFELENGLAFENQSAMLTATVESLNYEDFDFVLTVNLSDKMSQDISYAVTSMAKTYGDASFVNEITKTTVEGDISYSSSDENIATVDSATGEVSIVGAGIATIQAIVSDTDEYASATASYTVNVSEKPITITGIKATNRPFDGTNLVDITGGTLEGIVSLDNVFANVPTTGTMADANVGIAKAVSIKDITLEGEDALNYTLTKPTGIVVDISKADFNGIKSDSANVLKTGATDATISLPQIPSDASFGAPVASGDVMASDMSILGDVLTYDVGISEVGKTGLITIPVSGSVNYNDYDIVITLTSIDKTMVTVSGISVSDKTYDGNVVNYTGTANSGAYTGELQYIWSSGTAPKDAGNYTLTVKVPESNPMYSGEQVINFEIVRKDISIDVKDKTATVNDALPPLTTSDYEVYGLVLGESLITEPTLVYDPVAPDMTIAGTARIIASGAVADANYNNVIIYSEGILSINEQSVPNRRPSSDDDNNDDSNDDIIIEDVEVPLAASLPFEDVSETDWFYEDVLYAYTNDLMKGVSDTIFDPLSSTTRAMLVTILHRMEGEPEVELMYGNAADVVQGSWYEMAISWAAKEGIILGIGEGMFAPDDAITREQLVTVLYRYNGSPKVDGMLDFVDDDEVSDWAYEAMIWAVDVGLIEGKTDGILDPKGTATRAEISAVIHRYLELS